MPIADNTNVMWMITYHISLLSGICWAFMKAFSRWMDEIATMVARAHELEYDMEIDRQVRLAEARISAASK